MFGSPATCFLRLQEHLDTAAWSCSGFQFEQHLEIAGRFLQVHGQDGPEDHEREEWHLKMEESAKAQPNCLCEGKAVKFKPTTL